MNSNINDNAISHNISLKKRKNIEIDGVLDVLDFDSSCVNLNTEMGLLCIEGEQLKILCMSKDSGKVEIVGKIDGLFYIDKQVRKKNNFFKNKA